MKILIDMRLIKRWSGLSPGDVVALPQDEARDLEAQGVAVRVTPSKKKRKPITAVHTVAKEG